MREEVGEEGKRRKRRRKSAIEIVFNVTLLYSLSNVDDDVFSFNSFLQNVIPKFTYNTNILPQYVTL